MEHFVETRKAPFPSAPESIRIRILARGSSETRFLDRLLDAVTDRIERVVPVAALFKVSPALVPLGSSLHYCLRETHSENAKCTPARSSAQQCELNSGIGAGDWLLFGASC